MDDKLLDMIVAQVMDKVGDNGDAAAAAAAAFANPGMTEFVGTAFGDTIGIVIANVDPVVHEKMGSGCQVSFDRYFERSYRRWPPDYGG